MLWSYVLYEVSIITTEKNQKRIPYQLIGFKSRKRRRRRCDDDDEKDEKIEQSV